MPDSDRNSDLRKSHFSRIVDKHAENCAFKFARLQVCGSFGSGMASRVVNVISTLFRLFHIDSDENMRSFFVYRCDNGLPSLMCALCDVPATMAGDDARLRQVSNAHVDNSIARVAGIFTVFHVRGKVNPITARRMIFAIPFVALLAQSSVFRKSRRHLIIHS